MNISVCRALNFQTQKHPFCQSFWTFSSYVSIDPSESPKAVDGTYQGSKGCLLKFWGPLRSVGRRRCARTYRGDVLFMLLMIPSHPLSLPTGLSGPTYPLEAEIEMNLAGRLTWEVSNCLSFSTQVERAVGSELVGKVVWIIYDIYGNWELRRENHCGTLGRLEPKAVILCLRTAPTCLKPPQHVWSRCQSMSKYRAWYVVMEPCQPLLAR